MRSLLAVLLALPASAVVDYGRVGHCVAVVSNGDQFGGEKQIVSSMDGDCRSGNKWWNRQTNSGHFRVDAGCRLTLFKDSRCSGRRTWTISAYRSSTSKTMIVESMTPYTWSDRISSSKCVCSGASMQRRAGLGLAPGGVNGSMLVEEEQAEDEDDEDDEDEGEEAEEDEEAEDENAERPEEEEGSDKADAALLQVYGEEAEGEEAQFPPSRWEVPNRRRRRGWKRTSNDACSWLFMASSAYKNSHKSWLQWAGRGECVNSDQGKYQPGGKQSGGYALSDPQCRVVFYSKPNCEGDKINFAPRTGGYRQYGAARLHSDFGELGNDWNNRIYSAKCQCKR